MSDSEDSDNELISALCPYCNVNEPIYTCPACFARSCSVDCCKRHKVFRQCSGVRDPAAFVKRSKLMTPMGINRDYNFLTAFEREAFRHEEEDAIKGSRKDVNKQLIDKAVKERCITVKWAPWRGFERAKLNQTRVKKNNIFWTLGWIFTEESNKRVLTHQVAENGSLRCALRQSAASMGKEQDNKARFYLSLESPSNNKKCVKLDPDATVRDNLRERTVLEFPDIVVSLNEQPPAGWEVVSDQRRIVELKDNSHSGNGHRRTNKVRETAKARRGDAGIIDATTAKRKETEDAGNSVSSRNQSKKPRIV